jgi:Flp pilus assembly pilin Flp
MTMMRALCRDDRGQDLAEYALLLSLISLALIAALTLIGGRLAEMFQAVAEAF